MLKGTVATLLPHILGVTAVSPILIGLFAIIGHTFPIFAKFKGGKAVATSGWCAFGICANVPTLFMDYICWNIVSL